MSTFTTEQKTSSRFYTLCQQFIILNKQREKTQYLTEFCVTNYIAGAQKEINT